MGLYCRLDWVPAFLTRTWDTEFFDYDNSTLVRTDHSVWSVEEQAVDTIDLNSDAAIGGRLGLVRPNASCQNDLLKMEFRVGSETVCCIFDDKLLLSWFIVCPGSMGNSEGCARS